MRQKVLIFGASGFVGNYLVNEFLSYNYIVFGADMVSPVANIPFFKVDLTNYDAVYNLIEISKPDIIINLAAISSVAKSWEYPQETVSINVIGSLNILESVKTLNRNIKVMFVGSSEEYESSDSILSEESKLNANNPYGISKITQEQFVKIYKEQYNMIVFYVRSFNHTGIGQNDNFVLPSFCKQIARIEKSGKDGIISVGNLKAKRDFSDVRDVVKAYRMIVEKGNCNEVYNVGSGLAYSIKEMLEYIISLCNHHITVKIDPVKVRPIDTLYICCDNTKLKNELNWNADFTIFDTLQEMYNYYLNNTECK